MLPAAGSWGLKPGWSSLSLCTALERWRGEEKGEATAGKLGLERGEMGGGGAVTECQSNGRRLDRTDDEEEGEKERVDGTRSLTLPCSVLVCDGLSTWRCGLPVVVVVVGNSSATWDSVPSSSSLLSASPKSPSLPFSSSSFLAFSVWSSLMSSPGASVASAASVPLTVWRACRLGRCRGREKGTLPYPN